MACPDSQQSCSARRWPRKGGPVEREGFMLGALRNLGGWADVRTIRRLAIEIADDQGVALTAAPGTARDVLRRLEGAGLVEARIEGTAAMYRAVAWTGMGRNR